MMGQYLSGPALLHVKEQHSLNLQSLTKYLRLTLVFM